MGLDSIELVMEVEKHFSISIPDPEAEKAYTVGKLVDCVGNILAVKAYDFSLRQRTFDLVKKHLVDVKPDTKDFTLNDVVADYLPIKNQELIIELESKLQLKLPGIHTYSLARNGILSKMREWLSFVEVDFTTVTWKKYIDFLLSANLEKLCPAIEYTSKYQIYLAVMRITVDKIGVSYSEIGIEKSFTDDLGVD